MYENLKKEIKRLKIKQTDIAKLIDELDKTISVKLNGKGEFKENQKKKIYNVLTKKGYKGTIDELFEYKEERKKYILKSNNETHLSLWLKEQMRANNISNQKLADTIKVSVDTISNWRNGNVKTIKNRDVLISLAKYFDVSPLDLMGYSNEGFEGFVDEDYYDYKIAINSITDEIYNLLLSRKYILNLDKKYLDFTEEIVKKIKSDIKEYVVKFYEDYIIDYCYLLAKDEKEENEINEKFNICKDIIEKEIKYYEKEIGEYNNQLNKYLKRNPTIEEIENLKGNEFKHKEELIKRKVVNSITTKKEGKKNNGKK